MEVNEINIKEISEYCIKNVFRTSTDKPGFVHIDFGKNRTSYQLRSIMVALKKELSKFTTKQFHKKLSYHWLVRFDQQVNTPFHLDNAEEQSFLMLGYEPSEIDSELHIADYHKYANDSSVAPKDYIKHFTPVFKEDESLLEPYTTKIKSFDRNTYKIVFINNSNPKSEPETLGVFHKAKMIKPDVNKTRIVNSVIFNMLSKDNIIEDEKKEKSFLKTEVISK
ncbi:hypothetical protein CW731_11325 [Polaribacter sp. ALD11]|uniref:hypothetical protein n=1 Tax=Polaribacter sp. ALD11 TaxID=2058137 RepID=UPI000C30D4D6|nr:hypothetical protein [Polaribacter sp. ALD11]AUC85842.1 hypothetical protein CW731_11325 [Polaribacter sp. ALD11]